MQILKNILMIGGGNSAITDAYGSSVDVPEIKIGISYGIDLDLRAANTNSDNSLLRPYPFAELSAATGFYLAIDGDWDHSTTPKLFITSGISLYQDADGYTHLCAELPNTAQTGIIAAVAANKSITLFCEIGGYAASGSAADAVFAFDFTLNIRNRIYLGDTVPETVENDPDYLTAAQIQAVIAEYLAAGISIGTVTSGTTASASITGAVPNQVLNLVLPKGDPGEDAVPEDGEDGRGIASITKISSSGLVDTYRITFTDNTSFDYTITNGSPGQRGQGMDFDASGSVAEKALYDDEEEGFKFAATVINSTAKTTTLYIWTKLSDDTADWSDALTFVFYSSESEATVLQPIEFDPPQEGAVSEYYHFSLSEYPNACVSKVALDTADGELILPYYSDLGVKKILKIGSECYIYFGRNIPSYTKGRIYLSQFVAAVATGSTDSGSGSETPGWENAAEDIYYGYIPSEDASSLNSVADITQAMIEAAIEDGTVTRVEDNALEEEITVPRYGWLFVAVPNDSSFVAKKDDGFGAQVAFSETNGVTGTSATGLKFYGEFSLVSATHTIYVSGTGPASGGSSSGSGNSSSGGNSNSGSGTAAPASQQIIELTSTAISPADNSVYYHDLASGDAFTIDLDALQDRQQWYFELDLVQPATPVSFTFPAGIVWGDGLNFDPDNPPPVCNEGSKIYSLIFRLRNFRGRKYVLANLAMVETVPDDEEEEESEEGEE